MSEVKKQTRRRLLPAAKGGKGGPGPQGEENVCVPCLSVDYPVGCLLLPSIETGNTSEQGTQEEEIADLTQRT